MPKIAFLECSRCGNQVSAEVPYTVCPVDGGTLYVRYDLEALRRTARRERPAELAANSPVSLGMWRYREVLPDAEPVTLGEGWTPMVASQRYPGLLVKEEGTNPTGTFKARGLGLAVTMARHYGMKHLAVPSAGNAAGALAAYAAAAGITAHLFMPKDVPLANYLEGVVYGADVTMVDGLISDCARMVVEKVNELKRQEANGQIGPEEVWFDVSTLKEPFRVEGKKTMGYEVVEQLGWQYPDAIFYPTGGGVGLIGMWKAVEEMEALGGVEGKRPRMYALQASGCEPMAKAFADGENQSEYFHGAATFASGLRVPKPYGDTIILDIVRRSGGKIVSSDDETILQSILDWARHEGLFLSPEGAAATAAFDTLRASGEIREGERVVLFNTGAGLKYTDTVAEAMRLRRPGTLPTSLPVGGIITPV